MKISINIIGILLVSLLIIPGLASADGMVIKPDPYSSRWDYLNESNQQAFINYEDGVEKMILSIGIQESDTGAVWIFPVPSDPSKVVIDVVTDLPELRGEEITKKAKSNLLLISEVLPSTQIYPIPFVSLRGAPAKARIDGPATLSNSLGWGDPAEIDVMVYEHLEKEGIVSEIITAKTAHGLYQYLQANNLSIEQGSLPVLDHYIGQDFTFVVSWLQETTETQSSQRGVFVTFPTDKIYYPLIPTSVYGSEVIPATIRIMGHRSPEIFKDIKGYVKTEYYIQEPLVGTVASGLGAFYNSPDTSFKYTKIEISAPSKLLTNDLWINSGAPIKTYYTLFFSEHPWISGILLLVLSSIITSMLLGWIMFRDLRNKKGILKLALLGLFNCLSILGFLIASFFFRTKAKNKKAISLASQLIAKGYGWKRGLAVILICIASPFLGFGAVMLPYFLSDVLRYGSISGYGLPLTIIYVIPILFVIVAMFIKRIKTEDKALFTQLKAIGYSSWSFVPKDKLKFVFVPIFSVSFLIISWLIIKLVEITV